MNLLRFFMLLFFTTLVNTGVAASLQDADLTGTYRVDNGDGYVGKVWIEHQGEVYRIAARVGDSEVYSGVGLREGDIFSMGYRNQDGVGGVALFHIQPDGSLVGRWSRTDGNGKVRNSTLFKESSSAGGFPAASATKLTNP